MTQRLPMTRRSRRATGLTLIETTAALMLLTLLGSAALSLTAQLTRQGRTATGYVDDILHSRSALSRFTADVRRASEATPTANGAVLRGPAGEVRYAIEDGTLLRRCGDRVEVVAHRIRTLEVRVHLPLVDISLEIAPRRAGAEAGGVLETSARCRAHADAAQPPRTGR